MVLVFEIDGTPVAFSRNPFTGRCRLTSDTESRELDSPFDLRTHFSLALTKRWQCSIKGHEVVVEKQRPLLMAGFRPQSYCIYVDGKLVQQASGY